MKLCRKMLYASYNFKYLGMRIDESLNLTDNATGAAVKLYKQMPFI